MMGFRQVDPRFPFLWESSEQPAGRWHGPGEGPAHYFADTPDGAWAELVRHEEIVEPDDLETIRRAMWVVELGDGPATEVELRHDLATGGIDTYPACQLHARELRARGAWRLRAPSAALEPNGATGWQVRDGERAGPPCDGRVYVTFGSPAPLNGWCVSPCATPPPHVLERVRHFPPRPGDVPRPARTRPSRPRPARRSVDGR
jgi:hypothetical protein